MGPARFRRELINLCKAASGYGCSLMQSSISAVGIERRCSTPPLFWFPFGLMLVLNFLTSDPVKIAVLNRSWFECVEVVPIPQASFWSGMCDVSSDSLKWLCFALDSWHETFLLSWITHCYPSDRSRAFKPEMGERWRDVRSGYLEACSATQQEWRWVSCIWIASSFS